MKTYQNHVDQAKMSEYLVLSMKISVTCFARCASLVEHVNGNVFVRFFVYNRVKFIDKIGLDKQFIKKNIY